MSHDEQLLSAIDALYEAALDESLWAEALAALAAATASQAATFWVLDSSEQPRLPTFIAFNFDPAFIAEYQNAGMVPLDPTVQYLVSHPEALIVHDGLVISEQEKERHAYYDWHGRHSDTRYRMVGQTQPAAQVQAGVALHRTRRIGRYEPADIERFRLLHRHLARALAFGFRLGTLGTLQQCATELLDRHPAAIVVLDVDGRVAYANRRADDITQSHDGVAVSARGVGLTDTRDDARLRALIARAMPTASGASVAGVMRASRPSGRQSYGVFVTPMSRHSSILSVLRPAVCVMITDPDGSPASLAERLGLLFGLTDAEARLAELIASGDELRVVSEKLGITYGTARVRLAEIFQKTNTHRQGELVRLLLAITAAS